ncbi:MAG TPA: hypothetical protein VIY52_08210 [Streptosporangiaceae bacterium]
MAAIGEPYSTARRAVQAGPDHPAPLARPPAIDPREHAVHSRRWGVLGCYLVRYEGRYSAWITSADPGDRSQAYAMPSEAVGRAFTLKPAFGIWFSQPPGPGPQRPRARGR